MKTVRLLVDLEFCEKANIEGKIEGSDLGTLRRIRRHIERLGAA